MLTAEVDAATVLEEEAWEEACEVGDEEAPVEVEEPSLVVLESTDVFEAETAVVAEEDTTCVEAVDFESSALVLDLEGDASVDVCTEVEAWLVCAVVDPEVLASLEEGGWVEVLSEVTLTGVVLVGEAVATAEVLVLLAPCLLASSTKLSATSAFCR